jgi:pyruvate dehydrogenase E1 component alpha subunit
MMAELAGRSTGLNRGRGGSMHAADVGIGILGANAIVGAATPIAVGAAWAARHVRNNRVVATFVGDGGLNQGVVFEAMNLAALLRLPVLFVCENNGYATTMPLRASVAGTPTGRAAAFGIPAVTVDGMDVEVVRDAAAEAVARARGGDGPSFIECLTYRFGPHHTMEHRINIKLTYRGQDEIAEWRHRDPLAIQGARITAGERERLDTEVAGLIEAAVEFARSSPGPDPADALDYLYADGLRTRTGMG